MDISSSDKNLIARTILSEAAQDGPSGMAAAAWTIKNRLRSGQFGDSVRQVVLKPFAFEPWSLSIRNKNHPLHWSPNSNLYKQASSVVDDVWNDKTEDPTGGATHFFSPTGQRKFGRRDPAWSKTEQLAHVGGHKFYAPEGRVPKDWLDSLAKGEKAPAPAQSVAPGNDWLSKLAAAPDEQKDTKEEPNEYLEQLGVGSRAFTRGIPIVGPYLDEATKHAAAAMRSAKFKTPFADELKTINEHADEMEKKHSVTNTVGELGGGITGLALAGMAAPTAMGLAGSLLTRTAAGALSGGAINATDAAIRSGGDPYQTALGGATGTAFGLGGPLGGKIIGAGVRKVLGMANTGKTYLEQKAAQLGINIRPPQTSTSGFVKKVDQMAGQLPGGKGAQEAAQQQKEIIRGAAQTFGANDFSQAEMSAARKRLGDSFDAVTKRMTAAHDLPFQDTIDSIRKQASFYPEGDEKQIGKLIEHVTGEFSQDGSMPGETYRAMTKKGTFLDDATKDGNPNYRRSAIKLRDALDDSAIRWSAPEDAAQLAQTKLAWKNMKTVEPVANKPFSIPALRQAVNSSFKDRAYTGTGKSDLGDIVEIGEKYMQQPRDSGTPSGNAIMGMLGQYGPKLAGAALFGGAGYAQGDSPVDVAKDAAYGFAGTMALSKAAKTVLNNPALLSGVLERTQYAAPAARNALTVDIGTRPGYYQEPQQ